MGPHIIALFERKLIERCKKIFIKFSPIFSIWAWLRVLRYRRNSRNYVWKVKVWFKLFFLFIEKLLELLRIHSSFLQNFKLKSFTKNDIIFWIVLTFGKYLKHLNINTSILNIWTLLLKYLLIHLSPTCLLLQLY